MNKHLPVAVCGNQRGFTLAELLVALFIFSLISVAGVALLRSSADGQIVLKKRLSGHSAVMRTANVLEADLAQAAALPVRINSGASIAAFSSDPSAAPESQGLLFAFSRNGLWHGSDSSKVGRSAYFFSGGVLQRRSWPIADGTAASAAAPLLNELQSISVRFRSEDGQWRSDWTASDLKTLPRAVEIIIKPELKAEYKMVILVGPQSRDLAGQQALQAQQERRPVNSQAAKALPQQGPQQGPKDAR